MLEYIVLGVVLGGFGYFVYTKVTAKKTEGGGSGYPSEPKYPPHDPK